MCASDAPSPERQGGEPPSDPWRGQTVTPHHLCPGNCLEAQMLAWGLCRRTGKWPSSRDTCHRNRACVVTLDLRQCRYTQKVMETWNFTLTSGTTRAQVMSVT